MFCSMDAPSVLPLSGERITAIEPQPEPARQVAIPLPVDPHVHLDKTFIFGRCKPTSPGLFGAIEATQADLVNWSEDDLRSRIGLCA